MLPSRRYRKGQKPKITGKSANGPVSKHEEHWIFPNKTPTKMEEKRMFAKALEIATLTLFQTHLYQFNGTIFKQKNGAPIGLRASAAAARIVMGMFDRRLELVCRKENIKVKTRFRYVDDCRLILKSISRGWRWEDGRLKFRKTWELEEKKAGVSDEQKTAGVMLQIMDDIFPFLNFEMETPEQFPKSRLPTLDFQVWLKGERVQYLFFQKEMARKQVINKHSALGENVKISSINQNLVRRMFVTSEEVDMEERIKVVDEFGDQLQASGYSWKQTQDIVRAGLKGYENKLRKCKESNRNLHRSAEEGLHARKKNALLGPQRWFLGKRKETKNTKSSGRQRKQTPKTVTVLFVPQTRRGELAKRLQHVENDIAKVTGSRVRVVERGGTMVKKILHKSIPWAGGNCVRRRCLPCFNNDGKGRLQKKK